MNDFSAGGRWSGRISEENALAGLRFALVGDTEPKCACRCGVRFDPGSADLDNNAVAGLPDIALSASKTNRRQKNQQADTPMLEKSGRTVTDGKQLSWLCGNTENLIS
ncbi:MAG: hypothetical protein ABSG78_18230 [Verrucomicrobiota bacterium]